MTCTTRMRSVIRHPSSKSVRATTICRVVTRNPRDFTASYDTISLSSRRDATRCGSHRNFQRVPRQNFYPTRFPERLFRRARVKNETQSQETRRFNVSSQVLMCRIQRSPPEIFTSPDWRTRQWKKKNKNQNKNKRKTS